MYDITTDKNILAIINNDEIINDDFIDDETNEEIDKIILDIFLPYIILLRMQLKNKEFRENIKNYLNK